jgi:hypothetical protein
LKRITKRFKTLRQAENYQNRLYNKYTSVKLIRSPLFEEEGDYIWQVSNS